MVDPIVKHNLNLMLSAEHGGMVYAMLSKNWIKASSGRKTAATAVRVSDDNPFATLKTDLKDEKFEYTVVAFPFNQDSGRISTFMAGAPNPGEAVGKFYIFRRAIIMPKTWAGRMIYKLFESTEHPKVREVKFPEEASKSAKLNIELSMKMYNQI